MLEFLPGFILEDCVLCSGDPRLWERRGFFPVDAIRLQLKDFTLMLCNIHTELEEADAE